MNEEKITQQIKQVKQLIVDRRFKKAFAILADIIEEIDRLDQEDVDDGALENKMLMIRSRFNTFHQENLKGIQTDKSEINRITFSILQFLDEVKDIAIEYATLPAKVEEPPPTTNIPPPETVATGVLENVPAVPQAERNGCLIAFTNKDTNVNIQMRNFSPAKTILSIGAVVVALGLLFFLFRTGCHPLPLPPDPGVTPGKIVDTTVNSKPSEATVPLGPNARALNLPPNSLEAKIANYLSDPGSTFPKVFEADQIRFSHNSDQLSPAGKAQLDQLAIILKTYPNATIDIFGFYLEHENLNAQGNKENGTNLGDARARAVMNYLSTRGINQSRLGGMDNGLSMQPTVSIQLNRR